MNYQTICKQNQYLYGQLEDNYWLIQEFLKVDPLADVSDLMSARANLKAEIDINLDRLEKFLNNEVKKRRVERIYKVNRDSKMQERIIKTYKGNPDLSELMIAQMFDVTV